MSLSIILHDFTLGLTEPSFAQHEINRNFIKYMATAKCVSENISEAEAANEILIKVKALSDRYSVKDNHVSKRTICALESASFFKGEIGPDNLPPVYRNLLQSGQGEDISKRMQLFQKYAVDFLTELYASRTAPDEIIYVTSTGYYSPTPVQVLLNEKKWYQVEIKNCLNLDCYAAVPAVKMAMASLAEQPDKKVDIVHAEIQSLHLDLLNEDPASILINSLFGDGGIAYAATYHSGTINNGLKVIDAYEMMIPDSLSQMGWNVGTEHFEMVLSPLVPHSIAEHIEAFIETFAGRTEADVTSWQKNAVWAVHPGGPKIVDLVAEKLRLNETQLKYSRAVLNEYGNMSSSTLPYIWKRIVEDEEVLSGQQIISLAFGPGLTACALVMEKL